MEGTESWGKGSRGGVTKVQGGEGGGDSEGVTKVGTEGVSQQGEQSWTRPASKTFKASSIESETSPKRDSAWE